MARDERDGVGEVCAWARRADALEAEERQRWDWAGIGVDRVIARVGGGRCGEEERERACSPCRRFASVVDPGGRRG